MAAGVVGVLWDSGQRMFPTSTVAVSSRRSSPRRLTQERSSTCCSPTLSVLTFCTSESPV